MAGSTSISVATARDAGALQVLRSAVALGMTERFGEGHWSAIPSKADVVRQLRASRVLVAREGTEVIGTVRLVRPLPGVFDSRAFTPVANALYVLGLAVAPGWRGRGVGRQIMEAAKEATRSAGAHALWLDAYEHEAGAGPFYAKCGFSRVGRSEHGGIPLVYFEWLVERDRRPGAA